MSDIPNDLYRQIFCHVPADSLYRLRSVCKGWRSIIDDHQFVKMHQQCHPTGEEYLFIRNSTGKLYALPLTSLVDDSQTSTEKITRGVTTAIFKNIVGSVPRIRGLPVASFHGLVTIPAEEPSMGWLLWNPFNGEFLKLPVCDEFVDMKVRIMPYSGVGYDAVNDDYKVVRIVPGEKIVIFIYSMKSNTWHRIEVENFRNSYIWIFDNGTGVFRNGSLYWVARVEDTATKKIVNCIISFDLTTETLSKVPLPPRLAGYEAEKCSLQLDVLGDHFFLSSSYRRYNLIRFDLLMTANIASENTWIRILSSPDNYYNINEKHIRPVAYLKNKELVLLQMFNREFWWCDVKNKCLKSVKISGLPKNFSSQVFPASLVRVLKGNDSAYHDGIASEGTLKRKRTRNKCYDYRLKLKITFPYNTVKSHLSWTSM